MSDEEKRVPHASWTITIEYKGSDGSTTWRDTLFGSNSVIVQKKGTWEMDSGIRPVDDCVALDMAYLMKMLHESGEFICPGGAKSVVVAFADGWS